MAEENITFYAIKSIVDPHIGQLNAIDKSEIVVEEYTTSASDIIAESDHIPNADENNGEYHELGNSEIIQEVSDEILQELDKLCRCCLSERTDLQSIFDNENCIPEMIMAFAAVQITSEDVMPTHICLQCVLQVSRTLAFKQQIETADATLRHYIARGNIDGIKLCINGTLELEQEISGTNEEKFRLFKSEYKVQQDDETIKVTQEFIKNNENLEEKIISDNIIVSGEFFDETNTFQIEETSEIENDTICVTNVSDDLLNEVISKDEEIEVETEDNKEEIIEEIDDGNKAETSLNSENISEEIVERKKGYRFSKNEERKISHWSCFVCKKRFSDHRRLNRHKKIHIENKPYVCSQCNKGFTERADLNRHLLRHTRSKESVSEPEHEYNCAECHMGFSVERDLRIHNSIHRTSDGIVCAECGKEFSTLGQLKRHVRIHFEDKPHKCRICQKGFPEMGSLTRHFRRHTGEQREKKHPCKYCGKKYYDNHSLNIHIRRHTGEKPWVCNICGKAFADSRLLNSHLKVHSSERPYPCNLCDKRFTHQSTLTTHLRTHTGEKPYICSVCGKTFIQSSNLSLHMRVHSGEKPYKCNVCSRSFASSSSLTMHTRTHTGEKPFVCQICNKNFARHDLSAHMRTHTGERPYECTQCVKRFTTSGQLSQHLRTHTGEKPYVCDVCNKACSTSSYLKKHKRSHCIVSQRIELNAKKELLDKEISQQINDVILAEGFPSLHELDCRESSPLSHVNMIDNIQTESIILSESQDESITVDKNLCQIIDPRAIIRIQRIPSCTNVKLKH